jgi:hypothetical protein
MMPIAADWAMLKSVNRGGQSHGAEHRGEDSELRRGAEQQRTRVGDQRAEVGHRADAHEDHQRRHTAVDGDQVELVQHAAV